MKSVFVILISCFSITSDYIWVC